MKRLIYFDDYAKSLRAFDIRQGLEPTPSVLPRTFFSNSATNSGSGRMSVSPSGDFGVFVGTMNNDGKGFGLITESSPTVVSAPIIISGSAYSCAASSSHYAIGSDSGDKLFVFERGTNHSVTMDKSGLGSVTGLVFSPDGSKLLVRHTSIPYARLYSTSNWAFVNAPSALASTGVNWSDECTFTPDGNYIVCTSVTTSPYLQVLHPDTLAIVWSTNTFGVAYFRSVTPDPLYPNKVLCFGPYASSYPVMARFTPATQTFEYATKVPNVGFHKGVADLENNRLYIVTDDVDRGGGMSRLATANLTTLELLPQTSWELVPDWKINYRIALIGSNKYQITGTVRDISNAPASREVRAYERATGKLMAKTTSNAVTGDYTLVLPNEGPYDVQFMIQPGEMLNDLFYARTISTLV